MKSTEKNEYIKIKLTFKSYNKSNTGIFIGPADKCHIISVKALDTVTSE